jgi:hypothetical protein
MPHLLSLISQNKATWEWCCAQASECSLLYKKSLTILMFMQSERTLASAQRFVRGGRGAREAVEVSEGSIVEEVEEGGRGPGEENKRQREL